MTLALCLPEPALGVPQAALTACAARQAMSAMVQLELPHLNVLTKVDLLNEPSKVRPQEMHAWFAF